MDLKRSSFYSILTRIAGLSGWLAGRNKQPVRNSKTQTEENRTNCQTADLTIVDSTGCVVILFGTDCCFIHSKRKWSCFKSIIGSLVFLNINGVVLSRSSYSWQEWSFWLQVWFCGQRFSVPSKVSTQNLWYLVISLWGRSVSKVPWIHSLFSMLTT